MPVRVDDAPAPRSAAEDDEDPLVFGLLDELEPIGRLKLPRSAGRKAEHMRIGSPAFFLSNIEESFGPGLERNLIDANIATASPIDGAAAAPKSLSSLRRTKDHTAGCIARSRKRGGSIRTSCSAASGATSRGRPWPETFGAWAGVCAWENPDGSELNTRVTSRALQWNRIKAYLLFGKRGRSRGYDPVFHSKNLFAQTPSVTGRDIAELPGYKSKCFVNYWCTMYNSDSNESIHETHRRHHDDTEGSQF